MRRTRRPARALAHLVDGSVQRLLVPQAGHLHVARPRLGEIRGDKGDKGRAGELPTCTWRGPLYENMLALPPGWKREGCVYLHACARQGALGGGGRGGLRIWLQHGIERGSESIMARPRDSARLQRGVGRAAAEQPVA